MKGKRNISLLLVLSLLCVTQPMKTEAKEVKAGEASGERILVWSDEFDAETIDDDKWSATKNIYVDNGCAVLPLIYNKEKDKWSEAWLTTQGRFGFQYGRVEARIRTTNDTGEYAAFWTMGYNKQSKEAAGDTDGYRWSKCGEIDIMEEYNAANGMAQPGAAIHWCDDTLNRGMAKGIGSKVDMSMSQWHIFAMEWDESQISIYYDDVCVGTIDYNALSYYNDINPFHMPQHLLLTNVIENKEAADKALSPTMWIDWVRVYAPKGEKTLVTEESITIEECGVRKAIENGKMHVGDKAYMNVAFQPENVVNQSYTMISADNQIAYVNGGVVNAVAPGKTTIFAISPNGKTAAFDIEVVYDSSKKALSGIKLEETDELLTQENAWYWGQYYRELDLSSPGVYTDLIKVEPGKTYTIESTNKCVSPKLSVIEYGQDGSYIKWADYKNGELMVSDKAQYIRLNMTLSKSGMSMSYTDYKYCLGYADFQIDRK